MKLNRRLFLRGLGGAAVAAPFLNSVAERAARAQGVADAGAPKRLIVMFHQNGCITDGWFPSNSHGELRAADYEDTTLAPLAPYANKLLVPRGIRAMNEWTPTLSLGQGNDSHTQVVGSYFTCVPVTPHSDEPFNFEAAFKFEAMPTAPSLDHVCGQQLSPNGVPLFLRVGGRLDGPQSGISYSAGETPFAGFGSLEEALAGLTGLYRPGGAPSSDEYLIARGNSILDVVKDDLETLERYDMSTADKDKLEAWKQLLGETTQASVQSAQCREEVAQSLGLSAANIEEYEGIGLDKVSAQLSSGLDGADLFSNIAVLSAICDANRVIFLKYPGNYIFRGLGLNSEIDSMNHRVGGASMGGICVENITDDLMKVDRFYAEKFAYLVGQLDGISEGDGTLLDNCVAVSLRESSDGSAMNLNNMPIIQAGGCGGYFKTGQAVNVDDGSSDLHRGNSQAPCRDVGEIDDFKETGTPVEFANAPINKYYCNLMNAIGVKAGADGFPLVGGSNEVTHYGMYDDTTDFASGGANPAKINDPGEFSDLRAN